MKSAIHVIPIDAYNSSQEAQWTDIDLLKDKQVWTYKDEEIPRLVEDLHSHGQRFIQIVVSAM